MIKTTLKIDGMACGMCEAHINDSVRRIFPVKKIKTSHRKGESVILTDTPLDEDKLGKTITDTGYTLLSVFAEPYERKGLFSKK